MNPSYCRIRVPLKAALERFAAWQQLPDVGPLVLANQDHPEINVDVGCTTLPGEPFCSWVDVATFVDADTLGFSEKGLLWVWRSKQA